MKPARALLLAWGLIAVCRCFAQPPAFRTQLIPLDSGVYVHLSSQIIDGAWFPCNGLVVLTADSAVLIDSGWGVKAADRIVHLIEEQLHRPVAACISTHFHDDRTGGVPWLRKHGVRTYANARTRVLATAQGKACPQYALADDTLLTIDGVTLRCWFPGPGHAPDNTVVWLPQQRILFGGCLVKSMEAQDLGNIHDADLAAWPATIRAVQARFPDVRTVVPGHQAWGDAALLQHTLDLLAAPRK